MKFTWLYAWVESKIVRNMDFIKYLKLIIHFQITPRFHVCETRLVDFENIKQNVTKTIRKDVLRTASHAYLYVKGYKKMCSSHKMSTR